MAYRPRCLESVQTSDEFSLKTVLRDGVLQEQPGPCIAAELGMLLPGIEADHGTGARQLLLAVGKDCRRGSFIEVARVNNQTLRTVDDYCDVARQYLTCMHNENVVHVEVAVSPQGFKRRGLEIKPCIEALASAFREALDNFGMTGGIIAGCRRDLPPDQALEMLNELRTCGDDILAVGLHGAELQNEPRLFERHFQFARAQGWHVVVHAGEEGPADYVAQAIDILAAERIDHGVRAEEDPGLLDRLC